MPMICEMCGSDSPAARPMMVEGTKLVLCPVCAKFGDDYKAASGPGGMAPSKTVIEQRLERREKRLQTRDVYAGTSSTEIVENYGRVVREARERTGMDLEAFANSILEKKGTLAKVEANNLVPDDKLRAKLEKALNIKLTEVVKSGVTVGGGAKPGSMTLSNFMKKE